MPSFRARVLALTVALGTVSGAAAADPPPTTVFAKLFGPSKPKTGPTARTSNAPPRPAGPAALPPDVLAASLRAEQDAWERRMAVCLKLREAGIAANDEALLRQVDDLERQATALYTARTRVLGLPKVAPLESLPEVKQAARSLVTPPEGDLDTAVRTAEARTPKDIIREVRP